MNPHAPTIAPEPVPAVVHADYRVEPLADGAVFRLTRPAKLNAITKPMLLGLAACLDALESRGAGLLVVTGEGTRAFCAGTDLAETREMPRAERLDKSQMARDLFFRLSRSSVLSVAAMNGLAYGGGLELAMACLFRVAAPHVAVSLPEIKLGLLPAYGGTQFLTALVGRSRALEMMMSGAPLSAADALAAGLLNRVLVTDEDVVQGALAFARSMTGFSRLALDGIRQCVDAAGDTVTPSGLAVEDRVVREVFVSEDATEGVAAFLEKRAPRFRNR